MVRGIDLFIEALRSDARCRAYPAIGRPSIQAGHVLPDDLARFHECCGGAVLFEGAPYDGRIVGPGELRPASRLLVSAPAPDDISSSWYVVFEGAGEQRVSIDLDPTRLGRCYDSSREAHGVRGSCRVVARSFSELLGRLVDAHGGEWYWRRRDFRPLGDAYDGW